MDNNNCETTAGSAEVVSRWEWGARNPVTREFIPSPVKMVFIHHTAGKWQSHNKEEAMRTVRSVQDFHVDKRGWNDIGYSFLVGEDGRAYEGRGWNVEGAHTKGYNRVALAFCVLGNFQERKANDCAIQALQDLICMGVKMGYIDTNYELFGHRDAGDTSCPGNMLYEQIQDWPHFSRRALRS